MEILIAAVVVALGITAGLIAGAHLLARRVPRPATGTASRTETVAPPPPARTHGEDLDAELRSRREELARFEQRIQDRETALGTQNELVETRKRDLEARATELDRAHERQLRELERVAGLSASQAKHLLLKELEDQVRHDSARLVRQIEEETKRDADRRVRNILAVVMQRLAAGHAAETTVSVVQLPADDMKGRIIGRGCCGLRAR